MKLVIRKPPPSPDLLLGMIRDSGGRGITPREMARQLKMPDRHGALGPALRELSRGGLVCSEWIPVKDPHHYAIQEARYYATATNSPEAADGPAADDDPPPRHERRLVVRLRRSG